MRLSQLRGQETLSSTENLLNYLLLWIDCILIIFDSFLSTVETRGCDVVAHFSHFLACGLITILDLFPLHHVTKIKHFTLK